jgi:hypothetical protein
MPERIKELRAGATHAVAVMVTSQISEAGRRSIGTSVQLCDKLKNENHGPLN